MEEADIPAFILANMPYFIAVNYQRLLEAQHPQEQVKLILHIYNLGLRALTSNLVNQYLIRDREKVNDPYLNELLWEKFDHLTTDAWEEILFTVLRAYESRQDLFFMLELHEFYWDTTRFPYRKRSEVKAPFDRLTQASLELEEKRLVPQDEAGWRALAEELKGHLQHILHSLSFLAKYDLIRVLDQHNDVYTFELHKGTHLSTEQRPSPKQTKLTPGWFYLRAGAEDFFRLDPWLMFWDREPEEKELVPASIGVYDRMFYEQRLRYLLTTPGQTRIDQQHVKDFFALIYDTIRKVKRKYQEAEKLTWVQLCDICEQITHQQMATVQRKYRTELYLQREHVRQQFETFLADPAKRGFVLVGKSGVGKSNFLLAFGEELQQTRGDVCVLMYDGANMRMSPTTTITRIISQDFSDRVHLSGQEVQQVWQEIDKIDGIQERLVILCIDAINENPEPTELLRQLNELVLSPWRWLKIVFSSRPETWQSIKRGVKLAEAFYYREQGSELAEVELEPFSYSEEMEPFSRQELPEVYAKYQRKFHLQTPCETLSKELRETLRDPLNLWLLATTYAGQAIPETVKTSELIALNVNTLQVRTLLQREDLQFLEHELVPLMVGVGRYSNVITAADLDAAGGALYNKVFSNHVLSDGRRMNQSFLRLVDADILIQQKLRSEHQIAIQFKYERFYEYFVGKRIASLSETQADRYAFFLELIEEIAGKKEPTGEKKTTSKPFLWGAVRNALVEEAKNPNSETILNLCRTTEQRMKEMMVNVLITLGLDDPKQVEGILRNLVPQEKRATEFRKIRQLVGKSAEKSDNQSLNARKIAIEVASNLGISWVLQATALQADSTIRAVAVRYSYHLWKRDREKGFHILEHLAENATRGLIPNSMAFESAMGLSTVIFFEHYKDETVLRRLQSIWREVIATILHIREESNRLGDIFREFLREQLLSFAIKAIFRLFDEFPAYRFVDYAGFKAFFQLEAVQKALYRNLVHYMDVEDSYSREQMEHDYLEVLKTNNLLLVLVEQMGLVAQACHAPLAFLPFLKQLFEEAKKNVISYPHLSYIANSVSSVLDRDPMIDEVFDFMVYIIEVCQEIYAKYPQTLPGTLCKAPEAVYLAPYISHQYRRKGTLRTAWFETRIEKALKENKPAYFDVLLNRELSVVAIESQKPRIALDAIELFFQRIMEAPAEKENAEIRQLIQSFLARLRVHYPDEVEDFLEEQQAPEEFRLEVRTNEPVETVGELIGLRSWFFLRDNVLLGSPQLRSLLIDLLDKAADFKDAPAWIEYFLRHVINVVYGGEALRQLK